MYLKIDDAVDPQEIYRLLTGSVCPRPIAWVSTLSASGVANLAPYSFFTVASCVPPVLAVTQVNPRSGGDKDTLNNLAATGEAIVHIVSADQVDSMNASCAPLAPDVSEFAAVGIEAESARLLRVPAVRAARVHFECRLRDVIRIAPTPLAGSIMLLDVVAININDELLVDGVINIDALDPVGKVGGDDYTYCHERTSRPRPD